MGNDKQGICVKCGDVNFLDEVGFCGDCFDVDKLEEQLKEQKARADEAEIVIGIQQQSHKEVLQKIGRLEETINSFLYIQPTRQDYINRAEKAEAKLNSIADELERIAINYDGDELIDKLEELAKKVRK